MTLAGPVVTPLVLALRYPSEYTGADGPSLPVPRMPAAPSAPASRSEPVQPSRRAVLPSSPEGPQRQSLREAAVLSPLLGDLRKTPRAPKAHPLLLPLLGERVGVRGLPGNHFRVVQRSPHASPCPANDRRIQSFAKKSAKTLPRQPDPLRGRAGEGAFPPSPPTPLLRCRVDR